MITIIIIMNMVSFDSYVIAFRLTWKQISKVRILFIEDVA